MGSVEKGWMKILIVYLLILFPSNAELGGIHIPTVIYNGALGQRATASSYYDYKANPILTHMYEPGKAIDGFVTRTSWWSSGALDEKVYWQLNMTNAPKNIDRIIIRWHAYLSAKNFRLSVSYNGNKFRTLYVAKDYNSSWDRVDEFRGTPAGGAFLYLRVDMDEPNVCEHEFQCGPTQRRLTRNGVVSGPTVYGIREVELWGTGHQSAAQNLHPTTILIVFCTILVSNI